MEQYSEPRKISTSTGVYELKVSDGLEDPEWDAFLSGLSHGHHVQSSMWSQAKIILGYRSLRVIVYENGEIIAGGQLLVRNLFPFVKIAYMSKGPVLSKWDPAVAKIILDELRRAAKTNRYQVIALQPINNDQEFMELLEANGYQPSWMELAPTATIYHDLSQDLEKILGEMKRQTRQNIRRSEREGITIREGTERDVSVFYELHLATSQRQGFTPYPLEYFTHLWKVFSQKGLISLIFAEYENQPVSSLLLIAFGDFVTPKILGWSGEHTGRRPNDAVFWGAIQWAKNRGYHYFDMEGIDRKGAELVLSGQPLPDELRRSPDFFKLGYGGSVCLLPQSYSLVLNRLWRWPYHQMFGLKGSGGALQKNFERFRRRFG